jgi:hypothetical protein
MAVFSLCACTDPEWEKQQLSQLTTKAAAQHAEQDASRERAHQSELQKLKIQITTSYETGRKEGYAAGFQAAHPGSLALDGPQRAAFGLFSIVGELALVISSICLCIHLMLRNAKSGGVAAKGCLALSGAILAFFLAPALGVNAVISSYLYMPAGPATWLWIISATFASIVILSAIDWILGEIAGPYLEGVCAMALAAITIVMAREFITALFAGSELWSYRLASIIVGVVCGGLVFSGFRMIKSLIPARSGGQK